MFQRFAGKFAASCIILAALMPQSLWAAKYAVVFKNPVVYNQIHSQIALSRKLSLADLKVVKNGRSTAFFTKNTKMKLQNPVGGLSALVLISADESEVTALEKNPDVLFVEKEVIYAAPKPIQGHQLTRAWDYKLQPLRGDLEILSSAGPRPWGIDAVKAPQAWAAGSSGAGARVAVLDSGIDRDHPSLRNQIEDSKDFVNDDNSPYPEADSVGHGTHVSGTIAGELATSGFVGVAPEAKLLIGRVCAPDGCSNLDVVAGIDWAVTERADVVNMSLGSQMSSRVEKMAVQRAEAAGVMIVAASGNSADQFPGRVGFPSAYSSVLSVGAIDEENLKADFSQWGPELDVVGPGVDVVSSVPLQFGRASEVMITFAEKSKVVPSFAFSASADAYNGVEADLVNCGTGKPEEMTNAAGKIALIKRGGISFGDKVKNALAAGAVGAIIFNNTEGALRGTLSPDGTTLVPLPAMSIEQAAGDALIQLLDGGKQVIGRMTTVKTDYDSYSGTSMATPHVAGVAALVRAANKNLSPEQVRSLLKSTAKALSPNTQNEFGSGLVDAEAAVQAALQQN